MSAGSSLLVMAKGQRDEFKRRSRRSREALEQAREAFARGDAEALRDILQGHTAFTHGELLVPDAWKAGAR
mgnify:CR=1 FL=1